MGNETPRYRRLRHDVHIDAIVTRADGSAAVCTIHDFSLDGCCVSGFFKVGDRIKLGAQQIGELPAEIRWASMGRAGASFLTHSSPRVRRGSGKLESAGRALHADQRGVAVIEYALLVSLIALSILGSLIATGNATERTYGEVDTAVAGSVYQIP